MSRIKAKRRARQTVNKVGAPSGLVTSSVASGLGTELLESSNADHGVQILSTAPGSEVSAWTRALLHPLTRLLAVVLTLTAVLRWLFFQFSEKIWAWHENVPLNELTNWTRNTIEQDGIEPQVLLLLILFLAVATATAMVLLEKVSARPRAIVVTMCLAAAAAFAFVVAPRAPMAQVDASWTHVLVAEAVVLLAGLVALRVARLRLRSALVALELLLAPVCFIATGRVSYVDLSCVLAPALRLRLGFSPSEIYFQYDYLLSVLAVAWHWLGGDPSALRFFTQISCYLFLIGCFYLARRLFVDRSLAPLLLVALCGVRIYAIMTDVNALPQVTPLRLDLWILLLTPALFFGLEHWSVGLAAGLVYFFSRSFGTLYLGSYALALTADFLARRAAGEWALPFWQDVVASLRRSALSLALISVSVGSAALFFGGLISDATATYHRLGIGMMRISRDSFYWWVAPVLAAVGWLASSLRSSLPEKRAQAALFTVALAMGNSIYFFGRSHEHNLLNISGSLLLCVFLGIDLAATTLPKGSAWPRYLMRAAPWLLLALIGFFYSGRFVDKVHAQAGLVTRGELLPARKDDPVSTGACEEIASAVHNDPRVFVFSVYDYWFYERCGYAPQGYIQPLLLQPLKQELIEHLDQLLGQGYKIIVPKKKSFFDFSEVAVHLPQPVYRTDTANYFIVWRKQ